MIPQTVKVVLLLVGVHLALTSVISCEKGDKDDTAAQGKYFLSDIRPVFFENVNFESAEVVKNVPRFKEDFFNTFNKLEEEYKAGQFKSEEDLHYYRLASQYYGFYLSGLVAAVLDSNLTLQQITGNRATGLFTNIPVTQPNFQAMELEAMSVRSRSVVFNAVSLNNDHDEKTYGFYLLCNLVGSRLKNSQNNATPDAHKLITDFSGRILTNLEYVPVWNVLMAQVFMTNYDDPLNTFENPELDYLFSNIQSKLYPGSLPDLGGKYPEIVGPLYRFDLIFKKIDWMLRNPGTAEMDLMTIQLYITTMETIVTYLETDKKALLDTWHQKYTIDLRKEKLNELKRYLADMPNTAKPVLRDFFNSREFKKAYQCYSCHKTSGL